MTLEQAKYIKHLRCGDIMHSWRRISELYVDTYDIDNDLRGIQMHGSDLCKEAAELLGEDPNDPKWG